MDLCSRWEFSCIQRIESAYVVFIIFRMVWKVGLLNSSTLPTCEAKNSTEIALYAGSCVCWSSTEKGKLNFQFFLIKISQYFINSRSLPEKLVAAGEERLWVCLTLLFDGSGSAHRIRLVPHVPHFPKDIEKHPKNTRHLKSIKKAFCAFS